ncbi:MAG: hypothetical protein GWN64_16810, partial [Candidatus Thorarchaeota archaeon]|nr:hypothetical protein [Candidatus Thorarchaeota archaeon]
ARKFYSFNPEAETDPIDEDMHRKCDMTKPHLKEWEWPDGQVLKWVEFYGESDYEFNGEIFKEK